MYPVPFNEQRRLEALNSYEILDTRPEEAFDALTRLACRLFAVPIALVSLVDSERQWFKSCYGLDTRETDRECAFCAYAIMGTSTMVVHDAAMDPRFSANALVSDGPKFAFTLERL